MNIKNKKILSFLLLVIILLSNIKPVLALSFENGQVVTLEKDHDCISVLKIKGEDLLKGVTYVVYRDSETGRKQPAFCVEPSQEGVGTGAGDSYDVTLDFMKDQSLWRILYKGYMGSEYINWGLECDDDLYYATKTAVHCLVDGITPIDKYEVPHRVGWGEDVSYEEVQRRGAKVLEVAQQLYDFGIHSKETYLVPEFKINIEEENIKQKIDGEEYLVQICSVSGNREIHSYEVRTENFPEGTKILDSYNQETNKMIKENFKIAIPTKNILKNQTGTIKLTDIEAISYPVFYAKAYDENLQDYIIYADKVEKASAYSTLKIDAYKSTLQIVKVDTETRKELEGVTFNAKYADTNELIGDFTTDASGKIMIKNLRQGKIVLTEKSTTEDYILNPESIEVELGYDETKEITFENDPVDLKVNVEKTGFVEAQSGQNIYYDFKNIKNNSNVELENFIWTDMLPSEAVRADKIYTGTYNQELEYSVWYKTNKNDFKILEENLSTQINNEISFRDLQLEEDEYITEYEFRFGKVKIGFSEIEKPRLYCDVINTLENKTIFTNTTKVKGNYLEKEVEDEDYWKTIIYNKEPEPEILPRTGY